MKVRVIKPFRDKHTNEIRRKGQEIEVTKERYEELSSAAFGPFVEEVKDGKEVKAEKKPEEKAAPKKKDKK